jgi:hypothetical protein
MLTRWMTVFFWKKCPQFKLQNHVQLNPLRDPEEFKKEVHSFTTSGFKEDEPLWKIVLFPNYKDAETKSESTIVFKFHHCGGDFFGWVGFVHDIFDHDPELTSQLEKLLRNNKPKNKGQNSGGYLFKLVFFSLAETFYTLFKGIFKRI